jgi:hypothetical protein
MREAEIIVHFPDSAIAVSRSQPPTSDAPSEIGWQHQRLRRFTAKWIGSELSVMPAILSPRRKIRLVDGRIVQTDAAALHRVS